LRVQTTFIKYDCSIYHIGCPHVTDKRGSQSKGVGRKISRGGATKKIPKNSKKYRKIALLILFHGGATEKRPKNSKKKIEK